MIRTGWIQPYMQSAFTDVGNCTYCVACMADISPIFQNHRYAEIILLKWKTESLCRVRWLNPTLYCRMRNLWWDSFKTGSWMRWVVFLDWRQTFIDVGICFSLFHGGVGRVVWEARAISTLECGASLLRSCLLQYSFIKMESTLVCSKRSPKGSCT